MILALAFVVALVSVVVAVVAGHRDTRTGPLCDAPGPGRRDRRPLAPVVPLGPAPHEARVTLRRVGERRRA